MEDPGQVRTPILELAWSRYAQYDTASRKLTRAQHNLRIWVAIISLLATLFALLTNVYPEWMPSQGLSVIKILLIILPILASILSAFISKFFPGSSWLILRAGAEQILKEIYQFRTILQKNAGRRRWLETRLRDIQRQVYNGLNGELVLQPYTGSLPPSYESGFTRNDSGFGDLTPDEYFKVRIKDQLDWHVKKVNKHQNERVRLQVLILLSGGVGAFLAAMGGSFSLWVAFATAMTTALLGWQELRNLDMTVRNYSKVVIELSAIYDHWHNLEPNERTKREFNNMVQATETVLWNQNVEYLKSMQEVLDTNKDDGDLISQTMKQSVADDSASGDESSADASAATNELLTPLTMPAEKPKAEREKPDKEKPEKEKPADTTPPSAGVG